MPLAPAKRGSPTSTATPGAQDGEAIGRSRGGLSTKIHLAVDGRGRPLSILFTPGQAGDNPQLLALLDAIRVNEPGSANALNALIAAGASTAATWRDARDITRQTGSIRLGLPYYQ